MRSAALALVVPALLMAGDKPEAMPMPRLTPHHEALKAWEGTWDAEVHSAGLPGQPEQVSKGVETVRLVSGGLWAQVDFKADLGGMPFEGHGLFGYDPALRKHVGTWVDGMSAAMSVSSGRCDGQCRRIVSTFRGPGLDGRMTDIKEVSELVDADHRSEEMSWKARNGKFVKLMTIAYVRRK
ncbi:MAG TPA: DUF1579 domain-containing protein [Holophagaceae bacterium]|nr:DUF1579 domain-containing protein [Holophagaceae bacterium]